VAIPVSFNEENQGVSNAEFSKLFHDSFVNRQRYEWRFNFAIWGAFIALGGAALSKPNLVPELGALSKSILAVAISVIAISHAILLRKVHSGHDCDKAWKHFFRQRFLSEKAAPEPKYEMRPRATLYQDPWIAVPLVLTLVFGSASWLVVAEASRSAAEARCINALLAADPSVAPANARR
jgi:hypothetical protein